MKRKIHIIMLLTVIMSFILLLNLTVVADDSDKTVHIFLNNLELQLEESPVITTDNKILISINSLAKALGDEVMWNDENKSMAIKHGNKVLIATALDNYIYLAQDEYWVNWKKIELNIPVSYSNGQLNIIIDDFCKALELNIEWDDSNSTIYLSYNSNNKEKIDAETFKNIDTVYYILNNSNSQFDQYTDDFREFFDQRDTFVDAVTMGVSDIWAGTRDLISDLSNAETIMKETLEEILRAIPDNEVVTLDKNLLDEMKEWGVNGKNVFNTKKGVDDKFLIQHPKLKRLNTAIDAAGYIYDFTSFSAEQIAILLSNYEMNINYLDVLKKSLGGNDLDSSLNKSISRLESEYANKFLKILVNVRDELPEKEISLVMDKITGGVFSIGTFTWNEIFSLTGTTGKGKPLKTFYGAYCINSSLDVSYKKLYNKILTGEYNANEVSELKQLDDLQRATKYVLYESIKNITDDKKTQDYCESTMKLINRSCLNWNYSAILTFKMLPKEFDFSSGVGGWVTHLEIKSNGTFSGHFSDSNMGETGEGYPNGTVYICDFNGKFTSPVKVNDCIYSTQLESIIIEGKTDEIYYENEIRYIYSEPHGFDNAKEFFIYLPGAVVSELPNEFLLWSGLNPNICNTIPEGFYGLYNLNGEKGFIGISEKSVWRTYYKYNYEGLESSIIPSYNNLSHLLFYSNGGGVSIDLCFNWPQDGKTDFTAVDSKGSGDYDLSLNVDEDFTKITIFLSSSEGNDLSAWGGTKDGKLVAEYMRENY